MKKNEAENAAEVEFENEAGVNAVSPASGLEVANTQGRAISQLKKQQMLMGNFTPAALWSHNSPMSKDKRSSKTPM